MLPADIKIETIIGADVNHTEGIYRLPFGYKLGNNAEGCKKYK